MVVELGDGLVLRGEIDLPDVAAADAMLVLADNPDSTGLFVVNTSASGIEVTPRAGINPTRKQFRVTLDNTPAQRLATAARHAIEALIDDILIASAADALGAARAVMDLALEHAKRRRQFGQPIGAFQAVQHLCVDMYETVELARSGVLHGLWAADAADREERHLAAMRQGIRRPAGQRR
jgi:alkylation response protein AidB-like acyl-CoA dehydrogenase